MAIVTRSTVTTNRTAGGNTQHTVIPLWTIKLVTSVLCIIVLVLVLLESHYLWQTYTRTFICITLTTGYLLGWALPSVMNRFLPFHKVDVSLHSFSTALAVLSLILSIIYLVDNSNYSRSDDYRWMVAITICLAVEVVLLFILVSLVCYGNYTIVDTRS